LQRLDAAPFVQRVRFGALGARFGASSNVAMSAAIDGVTARQWHAAACALCHPARWRPVGCFGIGCARCQSALIECRAMSSSGKGASMLRAAEKEPPGSSAWTGRFRNFLPHPTAPLATVAGPKPPTPPLSVMRELPGASWPCCRSSCCSAARGARQVWAPTGDGRLPLQE
jgi:hypothetical protein